MEPRGITGRWTVPDGRLTTPDKARGTTAIGRNQRRPLSDEFLPGRDSYRQILGLTQNHRDPTRAGAGGKKSDQEEIPISSRHLVPVDQFI